MIGKLLSLVVHIPSKAIHSESATCKRQSERLWRTILLQLNMLISFPTFSQVWSLGLFLIIFFQEGKFAKTLLLIYYIHLFTDQSPTKSGWDEDASWLACLLGFGGQHKPGEKRSLIHRVIVFGFPFRSLCRRAYNFRLVREYFDAELIRTTELKETSTRNYMFLYHPHGIMAIGASALLCTDTAGFPQLFPGIHRSTCVLNACFLIPFFRDWMLANGFISANRDTMIQHLTTKDPKPKSVILMPGGSAEALHAHPGIFKVYLKDRKGFIRVALQTGCSLVPCIGFGENEVYETLYIHNQDSQLKDPAKLGSDNLAHLMAMGQWRKAFFQCQRKLAKLLTFSVPIMTHILPRRTKIVVVVGEPIHLDSVACGTSQCPDESLVRKYHSIYCNKIEELYNQHKQKYGIPGVELEIV